MKVFTILGLVLGMALAEDEVLPPFIELRGTVRDFSCFHSDFQPPAAALYPTRGLLHDTLVNGKPKFILPSNRTGKLCTDWIRYTDSTVKERCGDTTIANYGNLMFDEWYTDTPGVNVPYPVTLKLTLANGSASMYQFSSDRFFPIDNLGYGPREWMIVPPELVDDYDGIPRNFWFTTELRLEFYYRGGEIFQFRGDDDLWVFINEKLTACDVGGIHPRDTCAIDLDKLGLTKGTAYPMDVFHAERHTEKSNFQLSTSIRPINRAPIASDATIYVKHVTVENGEPIKLPVSAFDADDDPLTYELNPGVATFPPAPKNGTSTADQEAAPVAPVVATDPAMTELTFNKVNGTSDFTAILSNRTFLGRVEIPYRASDPTILSKTGYINLVVQDNGVPPIFMNDTVIRTVVGDETTIMLNATDEDTPRADLRWYLQDNPSLGNAFLNETSGNFTFKALIIGEERIPASVTDQVNSADGYITLLVAAAPIVGLSTPAVIGIVVGSVVALAIIAAAAAFFLYTYLAAGKFEALWQKEFQSAQIKDNPLFVSDVTETYNPLFAGG